VSAIWVFLRRLAERWRNARLARAALGKYVIASGSILHIGWAIFLFISGDAAEATPLRFLVQICGGRYRTAIVLLIVAALALALPFVRHPISNGLAGLLLLPQQVVLLISAESAIRAVVVGHYADGVRRPPMFIAADQFPVVCLTILYVIIVVEVAYGLAHKRREAEIASTPEATRRDGG
jgi:hypothetical protein